MTIKEVKVPQQIANYRCEDCIPSARVYKSYAGVLITQAIVDEIRRLAENHDSRHSTHNIKVELYQYAPEIDPAQVEVEF